MRIIRVQGDYTVEIRGLERLEQKMRQAVQVYPDIAINTMRRAGIRLRKELVQNTDDVGVGVITGNLKKGYRFSIPTTGSASRGMNVEGHLIAETRKNPHFHLIEHGHNMVPRGADKRPRNRPTNGEDEREHHGGQGRSGYHMAEKTLTEFAPKYPAIAMKCMDEILKKAGL